MPQIGLLLFIANLKGGKNFMYGIGQTANWFDYDLVSTYTIALLCKAKAEYAGSTWTRWSAKIVAFATAGGRRLCPISAAA